MPKAVTVATLGSSMGRAHEGSRNEVVTEDFAGLAIVIVERVS